MILERGTSYYRVFRTNSILITCLFFFVFAQKLQFLGYVNFNLFSFSLCLSLWIFLHVCLTVYKSLTICMSHYLLFMSIIAVREYFLPILYCFLWIAHFWISRIFWFTNRFCWNTDKTTKFYSIFNVIDMKFGV